MTENKYAIEAHGLGKRYQMYASSQDRLKQLFWGRRRRYYNDFWALQDVTLRVKRGETVAIIGRNGSGKSTLLQMLCGTLAPTTGNLKLHGRIAALLELGAGFNPEFTGHENVKLVATLLGLSAPEIAKKYQAILDFADIGDFISQPVKTYSSGMFVRLAFSVAVHVDPEILLIDEALAVGDIFFQQKCVAYMRDQLAGVTKLLVTHDMHAAVNLADRIIVLDRGRVIYCGEPAEAVATYIRLTHNEAFGNKSSVEAAAPEDVTPPPPRTTVNVPWKEVPADKRGGANDVSILSFAVTDTLGNEVSIAQPGDRVLVHLLLQASTPRENIIYGYIVSDRVGNNIFGENSLSSLDASQGLPAAGKYVVSFSFLWPEVRPDKYTITLGVGEGTHPLHHVIQCWAQHVVAIDAIVPGKIVHCLFNNPMENMDIRSLT